MEQLDQIFVWRVVGEAHLASASADRRKKGNFIAGGEARVPGGEFLIAGSHQGGAKIGERRESLRVAAEEIGERRAIRHFARVFDKAGKFLEASKEKDFDL